MAGIVIPEVKNSSTRGSNTTIKKGNWVHLAKSLKKIRLSER
jgi:hypothetical protein